MKIRDLTEDDICEKCSKYYSCSKCPLHLTGLVCIRDFINNLDYLSDEVLDRDVEL